MFSLTTLLIFLSSIDLKTQFTPKWTGLNIVEENFPITQAQCVMGDYNSTEQSIWSRPWKITCDTQCYPTHFSWQNTSGLTNMFYVFPLKKAHMFTLDGIDTHVTSHCLGQTDCSWQYYHPLHNVLAWLGKFCMQTEKDIECVTFSFSKFQGWITTGL